MMLSEKISWMFKMKLLTLHIIVLLLMVDGMYSYRFRDWDEQPRRRYDSFKVSNGESSIHRNVEQSETAPIDTMLRSSLKREVPPVQKNAELNNEFLFPDRIEPRRMQLGNVPICKGTTFCENVSGYPMDVVEKSIMYDRSLLNFKNTDVIDPVARRINADDTEALCVADERVVYPKTAQTMDSEWMFVLNHPNFTQGVRVETCQSEGTVCRVIDNPNEGYTTSCQQKYIYRQLAAIARNGTIGREFFRFPSTCCCHIKFTGLSSRINSHTRTSSTKNKRPRMM